MTSHEAHFMKRRHGFTLIELMIVLAIIAVLLLFAVPALYGSRKSGNESAIVGALRTIVTANNQHDIRFGGYATKFDELVNRGSSGARRRFFRLFNLIQ